MLKLDNLISAIYNSVIEAQKLTEQQHMRVLNRYFYNENDEGIPQEEIGKPVTAEVQLPYVKEDENGNDQISYKKVEIPLIALTPPSSLKINNMKVSFEANLLGFESEKRSKKGFSIKMFKLRKFGKVNTPETKEKENDYHQGPIMIDLKKMRNKKGIGTKIEIEFINSDSPETVARINDQIIKTFPF